MKHNIINTHITWPLLVHKLLSMVIFCFSICCMLGACTGLGKLSEGQYLLVESKIDLRNKAEIQNYKKIKGELGGELMKKPNGKFLWMRPGLAIYNTIQEPENQKGLRYWLKHKLGKAPVLLNEENCKKTDLALENWLFQIGHFDASSQYKILKNEKTASVIYQIDAGQPYLIDTLIWPIVDNKLTRTITEINGRTHIVKGQPYQLETIKAERERIDHDLKDLGFYYFNKDHLLIQADTSVSQHKVTLRMALKKNTPPEAFRVYRYGDITVAEDYQLENYHPDTTKSESYTIVSSSQFMRPRIFLNSVLPEQNDIYSRKKHYNSIRQLMGMGTYKYVNIRYDETNKQDSLLNTSVLLTPSPRMSISNEINVTSKSNNFAGPGMKISYKSRNFFRGAELFSINFNGTFEKQIKGEGQGDTAYELNLDASLGVPRLVPFKLAKLNKPYLPTTSFNMGVGVFARVSLYRFNTLNTGLEYGIRKNQNISHIFRPIDISMTNLSKTTSEFDDYLSQNPSVKRSFDEQFIIGLSYNFIINHLSNTSKPKYYVNVGFDPSGNLVALADRLFNGDQNSSDNQIIVFGAPVSQFYRIRGDFRYYFKTGKEALVATRLYGGVGVPYGSSSTMPYIKQFYAGGTNSLRAFRARSLGPGTYVSPDSLNNILVDQTGEIKLEANLEYRFPIVKYLKGALFADAGNIWLVNADSLRPGGKFNGETFYKELAIGLGAGIRIDVDVVVLRLDWAFPVRKPWLPEGNRWTFDEINIFDRRWRKQNLIWNISIGYPF